LATVGVAVTALAVALLAWLWGLDWRYAALLGAIVSSTDAAAVFAVLRASGIQLQRRVGITLEMESGLNDPMAVLLTVTFTDVIVRGTPLSPWLIVDVTRELALGLLFGLAFGRAARLVLKKSRLAAGGLYPVVTLALALVSFAVPTLLHGSGFLAVYVAAVVLGNDDRLPYRAGLLRVHDATAWVAQVGMFLLFGLLVTPSRLLDVAALGTVIGLLLTLVARPLAVLPCLLPFSYPWRDALYVAWTGLRGAVPIILATYPVMAGAPRADEVFHLVFFIVVINALVPGSTIRWLTDRLGMRSADPPPPPAVLEVTSAEDLHGRVLAFFVDRACAACGVPLRELPFPPGTSVMLVVRDKDLIAPRGDVTLTHGDHLYVVARPEDEPLVRLLLGRTEEL
jgi:cell volume regulation protein A